MGNRQGKRYILAIDQGTSGTKATLFDREGRLCGRSNVGSRQFYPQPGWVEQDAEEIYRNTLAAMRNLLDQTETDAGEIASIAISNQRETVLVWDKNTGKPVYNAVIWNCGRAADICQKLSSDRFASRIPEKTGLVLSPYFSAAKIKWILDHAKDARQKAEAGGLLFGTIDSWLVYKLTGGRVHATDYSNAARTQLLNIGDLRWDAELFDFFTIPIGMAPKVLFSDSVFGETDAEGIFPFPVPIAGVLGDSNAALFGQCCFRSGMTKATYGTGSSVMMNTGENRVRSHSGLVTSLAWGMGGRVEYVLEGNINFTGAVIKWLVEDMEFISGPKDCPLLAASVPDNGGVYLVPAFTGLSAPYWDSDAKAVVVGLTRGSKKAHIARAAEESIAYQICDVAGRMAEEAGVDLAELRVDGGPTRDNFLMQFQADILATAVERNKLEELSAAGAAYMSGLSAGFWAGKQELESLRTIDRRFDPAMPQAERNRLYAGWKDAIARSTLHPPCGGR